MSDSEDLDRSDATVVTIRYVDGRGERLILAPRSDGRTDVTEKRLCNDGTYREVRHELADRVHVETPE